ncbi:hypothetical protein K3G63_20500 [Hymenobacter sp. HSC-4F20]|uniref:DUF6799 domain-containing protein n=1 Tax=Hymenobacter sp. HSC-4F20 TaxID=2864135 RepID=UPI001C72B968|nr:DUF6799 domain-containing protein [Hymenobacter sp. HSC-4F20]MBX0292836.1 hypothetical protein [Hymenobacter sp. HSC-4F20]
MASPVFVIRLFALAGLLGAVQAPILAQTTPKASAATTPSPLKDGAFRRNGTVYRLQAGRATPLTTSMRFSNGATLTPTGTLTGKNGSRRQLPEGRAVNMQGDVVIYRDDMMSAQAIERHDEVTTGSKPTVVAIPASANLTALAAELQRTSQRLTQLRQLTNLLAERAASAAAGATETGNTEQRIQELSQQLRP